MLRLIWILFSLFLHRPANFDNLTPVSPNMARNRSSLRDFHQIWLDFGRSRFRAISTRIQPDLTQARPTFGEIERSWPDDGQALPGFDRVRLNSTEFGSMCTNCWPHSTNLFANFDLLWLGCGWTWSKVGRLLRGFDQLGRCCPRVAQIGPDIEALNVKLIHS